MVTSGHVWLKRLLILGTVLLMLAAALPVQAKPGGPGDTTTHKGKHPPIVRTAAHHDVSKPLRSIKVKDHAKPEKARDLPLKKLPRVAKPGLGKKGSGGNTVAKPEAKPGTKTTAPTSKTTAPAGVKSATSIGSPITDFVANFEGTGNNDGVLPPDTNGDVSSNYYVQWVNLSISVFDRTGNLLMGPTPGNELWTGFGGPCENQNDGDPIVQFDHSANQWLASQFALFASDGFHQCIAISQTDDPRGAWYLYDFLISETKVNDYPHFGVWPDAYYMSINQFDANTFEYAGAGAVAFERDKMLAGLPAKMVYFDVDGGNTNFGGMLPSDWDSLTPPPAGAPNLFAEQDDDAFGAVATDRLSFWAFHVDWANPANSTFGTDGLPSFFKETEPFDSNICGFSACIPQPGTDQGLDQISDRLMYRLQYRNDADGHETLVANHTVDVDGNDHAGIRWYELHGNAASAAPGTGAEWSIYQQGTYAPDDASRWMGSAALDASGNLALGFSVSSSSIYPSIRIATRTADDPLGTLPQDEMEMMTGTGSQTHPLARWGDYSSMSVDPDQCTLWYTTEYLTETSVADWHTRVGAFKLPTCAVGPHGTLQGTVTKSSGGVLVGARVRAGSASTFTNASGHYKFVLPVGTYDVTASAYGFRTETETGLEVTDGGNLIQDFALDALPTVQVSGTVRDGSGHGYALYARIDVGGAPIGPLYSDPMTGHYAVTLFQETQYTFKVTAQVPGYQVLLLDRTFGAATATQDFNLLVDPQTCNAPGYHLVIGGLFEPFETTTLPDDWEIIQQDSHGGATWRLDDPARRGNLTGGSGAFAIVDSDFAGPDGHQNTSLQTPNVNLTGIDHPAVIFNEDFFDYGPDDEFARVELSVNGANFVVVSDFTNGKSRHGPRLVTVPIPTAANQANVKVRFHYGDADFGFWWEVDNITVGTRDCVVTPGGGLIIGQVTDGNTNDPIDGATVASTDVPADTTTTANTATAGDGFYTLFSSVSGSHPFTADKKGYLQATETVNVVTGGVVRQDFELGAGRLLVDPDSLEVTVPLGGTTTTDFNLANKGAAAVAFELREGGASREILKPAGAPLILHKGHFSPYQEAEEDEHGGDGGGGEEEGDESIHPIKSPPWTEVTEYPNPIMDNTIGASDGFLYSVGGFDGNENTTAGQKYDPAANAWTPIAPMSFGREKPAATVIDGKLYVVGGWGNDGIPIGELEIYDTASDSWSGGAPVPAAYAAATAVSADGLMYVIGGCGDVFCGVQDAFVYDPAADGWASIAPYPEPISWEACGAIDGKIYCAGGVSDDNGETTSTYVYNPGDDTWSPLASMPQTAWGSGFTAAGSLLVVSGGVTDNFATVTNQGFAYDTASDEWTPIPNSNNSTYRGGSACGLYKVGGSEGGFEPIPDAELLPDLDDCGGGTDVPWLSEDPTEGSLAPHTAQDISVTFDASAEGVDQPGTYRARISFKEDTPYSVPAVNVTMNVEPPADWGKLTGTVTGLAVCDGPGEPLAGATVEVDGVTTDYTLKTDADGVFKIWMPAANGPVSVTISANGYVGTSANGLVITGGSTTTHDADLRLDAPCGSIDPLSIDVSLPTDQTVDVPLDLTNLGAAPFDFGPIAETPITLIGSQPPTGLAPVQAHSPIKSGPASLVGTSAGQRRTAAPAPAFVPAWGGAAIVPGGAARYAPAQCDGDPDHWYVFGGLDANFNLATNAWRYDATTDTFAPLAPMPEGFEASAAACDGGKVHVLGGSGTDAHYIYDIGSDSWSFGAPLPRPVEGAAAAAWDGHVYLIGGDDDFFPGNGVSDEVDIYDVASDSWIGTGASIPTPTGNMGYVQVGSTIYLAGGWVDFTDEDGAINTGATQAYDILADAWTSGPDLGTPRADLALAATDGALYALGGDGPGSDFFEPSNIAERLPTTSWPGGAWAPMEPLPIKVMGDSAGYCTLGIGGPDAEVWAAGGLRDLGGGFIIADGLTFYHETADEGCPTIRSDVPWLSEDPLAGTIEADGSGQVIVTIDTTGLAAGEYHATLLIPTTDPRLGEVRIPVNLSVGDVKLLISVEKDGTVGGVAAKKQDIVAVHSDGTGTIYFDGSDVGLGKFAIDAFGRLDDGSLLLSFKGGGNVPGISGKVEPADIVQFVPTSLGDDTAGTFSLYFDGSDVGLNKKEDNVDALDVMGDGSLLISTLGNTKPAPGISATGSDVLLFVPTSLGPTTAGTWSIYLDMSDVGLTTTDENLDALALWNGRVLLSTSGNLSVPGLTAQDDDIVIFDPTSTGPTTSGTWDPVPYLDGASIGIANNDITAIGLP